MLKYKRIVHSNSVVVGALTKLSSLVSPGAMTNDGPMLTINNGKMSAIEHGAWFGLDPSNMQANGDAATGSIGLKAPLNHTHPSDVSKVDCDNAVLANASFESILHNIRYTEYPAGLDHEMTAEVGTFLHIKAEKENTHVLLHLPVGADCIEGSVVMVCRVDYATKSESANIEITIDADIDGFIYVESKAMMFMRIKIPTTGRLRWVSIVGS